MRELKEQIIDNLLLLYIVNRTNELGNNIFGKTKLQKLCFLAEWQLMKHDMKGLHFNFFRYINGPFSKDLAKDYDFLVKNQNLYTYVFNLTADGKNILNAFLKCTRSISHNSNFFEILDSIIKKWGKYCGTDLMNFVYEMNIHPYDIPDREMKIREIPQYHDILVPEKYMRFKKQFNLPDEFVEDFIYLLNLDTESKKKMQTSSGVTYECRFG
jgi:uncharacterized protein YwgA